MRAIRFWLGVCFADHPIASMWDFPMNNRAGRVGMSNSGLLLTYLLLCGCGRSDERAAQTIKPESGQANTVTTQVDDAGVRTRSNAEQEALKQQRMAALSQELQVARAQQTALMQRQSDMSARLAAQQEEGMALLSALKAQMQSQANAEKSSSSDPEAFKKNARMQLESALEQDDRLTTEFEALTAELRSVDSRVRELAAQLDSLQVGNEAR
jgi:hypothetical protein